MSRPSLRLSHLALGLALAPVVPDTVIAQIEEITVTTRKREENLQDVPIAVTALSAEQIERQGISTLTDIAKLNPSMQFDTAYGPQDTRITIRGLSNTRGRSNVAFIVDGIDVTTENFINPGSGLLTNRRLLSDVERIEVVKGPQSALYGRSAFAGAISYVTAEPGDVVEGRVGVDLASYGQHELSAAVGGPVLGDLLGVRVTGVGWSSDGFYKNSVSRDQVGGGHGHGASLVAVLRPIEDMKWKARVAWSSDEYDPAATVRLAGDTERPYPAGAYEAGLGEPGVPAFIGLFDHGDSFMLPKSYGSARNKRVSLSEDPRTGGDYPGDRIEVLQGSLVGTWDVGPVTLSSYTGYTDGETFQRYDQDYQAVGRPDTLVSHQENDTDLTTRQFSQELRVTTALSGPLQFTFGGLYWEEERDLHNRNYVISCLPVRVVNVFTRELGPAPGYCDGTTGTVSSWQEYFAQLRPNEATLALYPELENYPGDRWSADTRHWSWYGVIDLVLTDRVAVSLEDRLVVEKFDMLKPNQSGCAVLGMIFTPLLSEAANPGYDAMCKSLYTYINGYDENDDSRNWKYISGTTSSRFHTPKVTLDWQITDDHMAYFSWALARKPAGINQVSSAGAAVAIEDEYFEPEKMEAWEAGLKTRWAAAGTLLLNGSVFFQDYKDKQVVTTRQVGDFLVPRVLNASAAEVWGVELEAAWHSDAVPGLALSLGYTWLDASYVDFFEDTRSLVRVAAVGECLPSPLPGYCRLDYSGHELERSPEHSLVASASLRRPLGATGLDWLAELNAQYQDERFVEVDNFTRFDSYWLLDARAGLVEDRWEAILYVTNLLDDDTLKSGGTGPDFGAQASELGFTAGLGVPMWFGTLPDPRVVGLRINVRFGSP